MYKNYHNLKQNQNKLELWGGFFVAKIRKKERFLIELKLRKDLLHYSNRKEIFSKFRA